MAQKQITVYIDDLTGKPLAEGVAETVSFGLDGVQYELDTDQKSAEKLRATLDQYVASGRRLGGPRGVASRRRKPSIADASEVRRWAVANGIEVSARGRVSAAVVAKYEAARG